MLTAAAHPDLVRGLVLIEAAPGDPNPQLPHDIGAWLDSWPTPFPTRQAAVDFFGSGPVGTGWAAGLEEREDGWHPRFDRRMMVASLAEIAQRAFRPAWRRVTCPALVILAQVPRRTPLRIPGIERLPYPSATGARRTRRARGGCLRDVAGPLPGVGHQLDFNSALTFSVLC